MGEHARKAKCSRGFSEVEDHKFMVALMGTFEL